MDIWIHSPSNIGQQLPCRRRIGPKKLIDRQNMHEFYGATMERSNLQTAHRQNASAWF
jgi:hypothetical protein